MDRRQFLVLNKLFIQFPKQKGHCGQLYKGHGHGLPVTLKISVAVDAVVKFEPCNNVLDMTCLVQIFIYTTVNSKIKIKKMKEINNSLP